MRIIPLMISVLLGAAIQTSAQTYITHANVVDVISQKILPDQTIVIQGNTIQQVGAFQKIKVPQGATVIDASGKWVTPGLVDAHVHFFQTGGLFTRPDAIDLRKYQPYEKEMEWYKTHMEEQLRRYISCGITTVLDLGATFNLLHMRDTFAGKWYSPRIVMAGPLISTAYTPKPFDQLDTPDAPIFPVNTPEEATKATQQQFSYKPDMIKIWYITDRQDPEGSARKREAMVKAVVSSAQEQHYRVAVHATNELPARLAVEAGANYLVHSVDNEVLNNNFIQLLLQHQVVLCPTLTVIDSYFQTFAQHYTPTAEDLEKGNPQQLGSLQELAALPDTATGETYKTVAAKRAGINARNDSISAVNLKKLADAGVPVATGTDAGNIGTLHASSYFKELRAMQQAGLSNWQLLTASTINGAKAAGREKEFGSITAGKAADLLILKGNPVTDLQQLQQVAYVINHGTILQPDTLVESTPADIVQRQLNAYNAHDIDAFLEYYAEDAIVYSFPDQPLAKGKEAIRKMYGFLKKVPGLHATLTSRMVQNNIVIDEERLSVPRDRKGRYGVAIYTVENKKISKVYLISK